MWARFRNQLRFTEANTHRVKGRDKQRRKKYIRWGKREAREERTIGISSERPESALASRKERRWRRWRRSSFEGGIVSTEIKRKRENGRECRKRAFLFFIKLTKNITNWEGKYRIYNKIIDKSCKNSGELSVRRRKSPLREEISVGRNQEERTPAKYNHSLSCANRWDGERLRFSFISLDFLPTRERNNLKQVFWVLFRVFLRIVWQIMVKQNKNY